MKYIAKTFVKLYEENGKLGYWKPWRKIEVEAVSLEDALNNASAILEKELREKIKLKEPTCLIDSIIDENMKHIQITSWDESGFPVS